MKDIKYNDIKYNLQSNQFSFEKPEDDLNYFKIKSIQYEINNYFKEKGTIIHKCELISFSTLLVYSVACCNSRVLLRFI